MRSINRSFCCNNAVTLSDIIGKPLEIRSYNGRAPHIGVRWICPDCNVDYFVIWLREDRFWDNIKDSQESILYDNLGQPYYNEYVNRFVQRRNGELEDTGSFSLVLSYYNKLWEEEGWESFDNNNTQLMWYYYDILVL